ncbi:MAG TPA: uracil-DNA glycosylase [Candidatus Paceibacterota bacterium]|nr:uracil-DNA glycosylase [Candidatus Paceibacterota bacterium]
MLLKKSNDRDNLLRQIRDEVVTLTESPLYIYRTTNNYLPVIGEGSHLAKIMFVGEAPGRNEAKTGRPFCGSAGKILDNLLAEAGLKREEVYITNIVKDRPQNNRDPLPEEIRIYGPFLDQQIDIIQPQVIATLGRYSTKYILEKFGLVEASRPIGELHGKVFEGKSTYGKVYIVPLYHPAATIYNQKLLPTLKKDFKILSKFK